MEAKCDGMFKRRFDEHPDRRLNRRRRRANWSCKIDEEAPNKTPKTGPGTNMQSG